MGLGRGSGANLLSAFIPTFKRYIYMIALRSCLPR